MCYIFRHTRLLHAIPFGKSRGAASHSPKGHACPPPPLPAGQLPVLPGSGSGTLARSARRASGGGARFAVYIERYWRAGLEQFEEIQIWVKAAWRNTTGKLRVPPVEMAQEQLHWALFILRRSQVGLLSRALQAVGACLALVVLYGKG